MAGKVLTDELDRNRALRSPASRPSTRPARTSDSGAGSSEFGLNDLTRALEQRRVVQGTLLRSTIHLVSAGDYWAFALGSRAARQTAWLRFDKKRLSSSDLKAAAKEVRKELAGRVGERAEMLALARERDPERPTHLWNGLSAWVDLVRAPAVGHVERRRAGRGRQVGGRAKQEEGENHAPAVRTFARPGAPRASRGGGTPGSLHGAGRRVACGRGRRIEELDRPARPARPAAEPFASDEFRSASRSQT